MTEIIIVKSQEEAGEIYARCTADLIRRKPDCVLGLATGSSPLAAYKALADLVHKEGIDVSQVRGFALDEYAGLDPAHPQSYRSTIDRTVVEPLGLDPAKVRVPNGNLDTIKDAGRVYDQAIEDAGGVDLQILGIGTDGHIGFNEPGSSLASGTRIKTLTEQTRIDNARFFDNDMDQVPTHCITQGIGTILKARQAGPPGFRRREGRSRGRERRGRHIVLLPGFRPPDASPRHRDRGRGGRLPPAQPRLLQVGICQQA